MPGGAGAPDRFNTHELAVVYSDPTRLPQDDRKEVVRWPRSSRLCQKVDVVQVGQGEVARMQLLLDLDQCGPQG